MTNSTLILQYEDNKEEFQVTWEDNVIIENQEIINQIMLKAFLSVEQQIKIPKMNIIFNVDTEITTEVVFSEEKGVFPLIAMSDLFEQKNNKDIIARSFPDSHIELYKVSEYGGEEIFCGNLSDYYDSK